MAPTSSPNKRHGATRKVMRPATELTEQFGLELLRQLQWHRWQAAEGHVKVLPVKNVSTQVLCVSYKLLHSSSAFSVDFPETYRLSPGMVANIKVHFRPPRRQSYTDQLLLLCGGNSIVVPLEAVLPASKLQLQSALDFGCVPAKEPVMQQLPIRNVGDAILRFDWKVEEPFAIVPSDGQLAPGQTLHCQVHFNPQEAAAYQVSAACSLDNGELLTVQIDGMAKFPFLSVEQSCMEFGDVVVGQASEAVIRFGNHSAVPANFTVTSAGGSSDGVFTIQPMQGALKPNSFSVLQVRYTPRSTGTFSCQTYTMSTPGGNKVTFVCQGTSVGPQLRLSSRVFNFGNVKAGQAPLSKVLYLENVSDVPVVFEFLVEANGVFSLTKSRGVVPPRSMMHTAVRFAGVIPANHWQRLVCLVKDSEPIAIDVLATCYDDNSRPPPLTYKHVAAYLDRVTAGEAPVPESRVLQSAGSSLGSRAVGSPAVAESAGNATNVGLQRQQLVSGSSLNLNRSNTSSPQSLLQPQQQQQQLLGPDSWRLLFDGLSAASAVSVSDTQLDFDSCSRLKPCEAKSFTVSNNTASKLLVSVIIPPWQDPLGPADKPAAVFQAFPENLELRPKSSATVRVAFRPPKDGLYYCQGLMLLTRLKAMRSFRLVQDGQDVVPPWCIEVMASGNTYVNMNPDLSPKVSLSTSSISFPPCRLGDAVHQTLALQNQGDAVVHFRFTAPRAGSGGALGRTAVEHVGGCEWFGPFGIVPSQGVLEPKSQRLVALRFKPASHGPSLLNLTCILNNTAANSATIMLSGSASEPQLSWDIPAGKLFFRPTCVGASSQRIVTVTNVSRVPVGWQWVLSRKLQEAVMMEPMKGVLRGFESAKVTVNFAPTVQQVYNARAALLLLTPDEVASEAPASTAAAEADANTSLLSITAAGLEEVGQLTTAVANTDGMSPQVQQQALGGADAEKLIVAIVGEATQGALSVEPSNVSFGVVNVGYPQHKTLSLINQSTGVLRFSVELVNESSETVEKDTAACEFAAPTAALLVGAGGAAAGSSKGCLEDCWIDEPDGIVNARSSKTLTLNFLPRRRGQYKLSLNLRASQLPQLPRSPGLRSALAGSSSSIAAAAAAGQGVTQGLVGVVPTSPVGLASKAAALSINGAASSHCLAPTEGEVPAADDTRAAAMSTAGDNLAGLRAKPPLTVVTVSATAAFPQLLVTYACCLGLPKQISWQMLGVEQLNKELCSAVSTAELQAQALSDKGSLTNDNAAALLPPFEVDMGVVAAGQVPRSFWVQVTNTGALPLNWELHSYDAPQVELENWVEPARPLTDAEKERAFIISNKIFDLYPHCGSLKPGETQQVCFTFDPVAEGTYKLPLFLRVKDGKQLQLQLKGQAVPAYAQLPLVVRGSQTCVLAAAPLGELEPPMQCYTLRNGGPAPLQYRLDITPLQQLVRQNYGAEVIKYAGGSPLIGVIPVGDVAVFNWLFQPLEAKAYSVALPLSLGPAAPQPLLLRGRGYHPVQHPEEAQPTGEEAAQRWQDWLGFSAAAVSAPPSKVLHVNQEVLDLAICLPASTTKRLLVLQNAAEVPLVFVWDLAVFREERGVISGRLSITPGSGVLEPGESRVCQVSFQSGLAPQLFSGEIFCYARPQQTAEEAAREEGEMMAGDQGLSSSTGMQSLGYVTVSSTAAAAGDEATGDQVEEVIAEHPARQVRRTSALRAKINNRLPLHLSMTASTRSKSRQLDLQYTNALTLQQQSTVQQQQQRQQQHTAGVPGSNGMGGCTGFKGLAESSGTASEVLGQSLAVVDAVEPQVLTVTVQGCVLYKAHVRNGSYIPAAQKQSALRLLEVSHLLPPVENPVSLMLPPGSLGPSAAAAKAVAAAATEGNAPKHAAAGLLAVPPAVVAAGDVLQEILAEVWADTDIVAAFEQLQPAPIAFADQVLGEEAVEVAVGGPSSQGQPMTPQQRGTADAAEDLAQRSPAANDTASVREPPHVSDTMRHPEFRAFVDYVVDNAIVGILQDSVQEGLLEQAMHRAD